MKNLKFAKVHLEECFEFVGVPHFHVKPLYIHIYIYLSESAYALSCCCSVTAQVQLRFLICKTIQAGKPRKSLNFNSIQAFQVG